MFAILLTLLPNLQEVVIWQNNRSLPQTASMISAIAQATLKSPDQKHALCKFHSFRMCQRGENEDVARDILVLFTAIPSLQRITGINVNLRVPPHGRQPFQKVNGWGPRPPTNVKSLVFEQSTVGYTAIPHLFAWGKFTMLRKLSLIHI